MLFPIFIPCKSSEVKPDKGRNFELERHGHDYVDKMIIERYKIDKVDYMRDSLLEHLCRLNMAYESEPTKYNHDRYFNFKDKVIELWTESY